MRSSARLVLFAGPLVAIMAGVLFSEFGNPHAIGPATEKRFPPLKVPAGFKATLFACDPLIEYPSVISIGPRPGALFVAIDYMTGLGIDHVRRDEIRLVEDTDGDGYADKATVFAKGFNSIQGLAYHDGTLYVMHAPFLTALRDTKKAGVADERKDLLTGLGLTPENNKVLLHCANGVAVGHDGWLYLAMGDNGVNVLRPEGDRLILNGGGILRCRPDGRDLHVFASGLRNIYDIALDAEQNVFVRDNENDGGTYMIRVCYSFHGADHGYPYLYANHPDEAMPPIADLGLGSSAGGVCYLERQFPPAYRGNLFFCEWGKSVVRYPLMQAGSGFAPTKEFEFAAGDGKDTYPFKPTDIVVQRDGTMMVADWADGQRPKRGRGRIYRLAYAGADSEPAKKKIGSQLDSESHYDRWEAQALLERAGKRVAFDHLGPRGRLHAIWALAKLDGPKAIDPLLQIASTDPAPSVRGQAIRAIADLADPVFLQHKLEPARGDRKLAERLAGLAKDQEPRVILEVIVALGRLRWADAPDWLKQNVSKPDATLAHAVQQALRRADSWPAVVRLLDETDAHPLRKIALRALADQYEPSVADGLMECLREDKNVIHRREYAELLARIYKKSGPWKYWGYRPGPKPVNTEAWGRTEAIGKALEGVLADPDHNLRIAVLKPMVREKVPIGVATLGNWLRGDFDAERVGVILASLADQPAKEARKYFQETVLQRKHSAANRLTALDMYIKQSDGGQWLELLSFARGVEDGPVLAEVFRRLGKHAKGAPPGLFASKLSSSDAEVRAAAIEALGETHGQVTKAELMKVLQDPNVRVRRAAAGAAGKVPVNGVNEPLLKLAADPDLGVRLACLDSLRRLKEPRVVPLAVTALHEPTLELAALACLHDLGSPAQMDAVVEFARRNPSSDGTVAAVRALSAWRHSNGTTERQRRELDNAVAEIHGATGILTRWRASNSLDFRDGEKIRPSLLRNGSIPADWRTLFGVGAEGRTQIAPKSLAAAPLSWFAATDVIAPGKTEVEFLASSHGGISVWLNGRPIHRRPQARKFQFDSDRFAGTLDKGVNHLLVELAPSGEAVEFHLRFRRRSAKAAHEKLTQAALLRAGNAERGRKIFINKEKSQCMKCHQLGNQGERIGPELTGVGGRFSRIYIIESILEPSRTIAPSFGTHIVTLKNGKTLNGVKIAETATTLTLADNQGQKHVLVKSEIDEQQPSALSTMPEGLEQRFTEDEFVDLIAFLASQKEGKAR